VFFLIRNHDVRNNFQEKYPLAMIHFLLCAVSSKKNISVPTSAISPLMYVDGTFKNLLNYPENCVSWLKFLNTRDPDSPIYQIYILFANRRLSDMIHDLEKIFEKFRGINQGRRGGDKFKVSDAYTGYGFSRNYIQKIEEVINLLSNLTGWHYYSNKWTLTNLNLFSYSKEIEEKLNKRKYFEIINGNPISLAVTATTRLEYTLETPDNF